MTMFLSVFLGGGLGASLRWGTGLLAMSIIGKTWPGTLIVNLFGTAILCLILKNRPLLSEPLGSFLTIGLMGGLTTFSTFSYEVAVHFSKGELKEAALIFLLNICFGIAMGIWILR